MIELEEMIEEVKGIRQQITRLMEENEDKCKEFWSSENAVITLLVRLEKLKERIDNEDIS